MNWQEFLGSNSIFLLTGIISLTAAGAFTISFTLSRRSDSSAGAWTAAASIVLLLGAILTVGHLCVKNDTNTAPVTCPVCSMEAETPFCGHCGAKVNATTQACPNCGKECDTPFCGDCGAQMNREG